MNTLEELIEKYEAILKMGKVREQHLKQFELQLDGILRKLEGDFEFLKTSVSSISIRKPNRFTENFHDDNLRECIDLLKAQIEIDQ